MHAEWNQTSLAPLHLPLRVDRPDQCASNPLTVSTKMAIANSSARNLCFKFRRRLLRLSGERVDGFSAAFRAQQTL